jgi:hypothetical protein
LARERDARLWVREWVARPRDEWAIATSRLLAVLDRECRAALNAGRPDVFGSVENLRPHWDRVVEEMSPPAPGDDSFRDALFTATLDRMVSDGDLLFVNDRQRVRSRFFETVHYLRHLRQRTQKYPRLEEAPGLVEMIKAEVAERERPVRESSHNDLLAAINEALEELREGSALPLDVGLAEVAEWSAAVFADFLASAFGGREFAEFQVSATIAILRAAFATESSARGVSVAAGTGFGKTEAFLLPILLHALIYKAGAAVRRRRGVSALLVYPRRDLCNDQAGRTVEYLVHLNRAMRDHWHEQFGDIAFEPLRVAVAHGGATAKLELPCPMCSHERRGAQQAGTWTVDDERRARLVAAPGPTSQDLRGLFHCERAGAAHDEAAQCVVYQLHSNSDDADLAITNLDTLHRRLMDGHGRRRLFGERQLAPRLVVLDEMHIYEGQSGAHAANIVRRLRQRVRRMPEANNRELVCVGASATVFDSRDLLWRLTGITATNITAIEPGLDEREPLGIEYFTFLQSPGNRLQRLGDDDDAEMGEDAAPVQERFVSEQASMIQAAMCLQHTMKTPGGGGIHKRRVLGFVDSLDVAARLARNLDNAEWQDAGPTQPSRVREMDKAPLYTLRLPSGRAGAQESLEPAIGAAAQIVRAHPAPRITFPPAGRECPRFETRDCRQPPHHLLATCKRYEQGECWYSMGLGGEEGLRPIVVQRHQSGARHWASPDLTFRREDDPNAWRLLVSTSALEVGFDNPELIATWQYHAPPSVSGFLQRKGRGGRGAADRPITMMVLGTSEADVFAFQHHDRYVEVDRARDLTCWVDPDNPALKSQHMVAALFDFCAARGDQKAYSMLEFTLIDQVLSNHRVQAVRWIADCFGIVPGRAEQLLHSFRQAMNAHWLQPVVPPGIAWGNAPRVPPELLQQLPADELRGRAQMIDGDSAAACRAREWLQAMAAQKSDAFRVTAPDFFASLPPWALPDNDLRLPGSTIAEPLGRDVELYAEGGANVGRDPAEFALNVFLPGGFKIRFNSRLWAAPWEPPRGWRPVPGTQLSRAAMSIEEPERPSPNVTADIRAREGRRSLRDFLLEHGSVASERRDQLVQRLGADAAVVLVSGLKVKEVGGIRNRRFTFDNASNIVRSSAQNVAVADRQQLMRDPNLTPQREILPLRAEHQEGESLMRPPFAAIRHYRRQPLLVVHTGNLVHCYPQEGGERTIAVHFYAADAPTRRILPAVMVRTEALELVPEAMPPEAWGATAIARLFWRRVSENLGQFLVIERGLLRSFYRVNGCLEALAALERRVGEFAEAPPSARTLSDRFAREVEWLPELEDLQPHVQAVAEALGEAATYAGSAGRHRAWAETLAAAFIRAAANRMHTSPKAFRTLVEPNDNGWRVLVFDDNEGGSGNARRVRQGLDNWAELQADMLQLMNCPVASGDVAVRDVLSSGQSADTLALLRAQGRLTDLLGGTVEQTTLRRLERLFEDCDIASFNLHAGAVSARSDNEFGALAPLPRVLRTLAHAPALDPRAEALRLLFKQGPAAELPSRLRAVRPLCVSGCPYCIGLGDTGYSDRTLLAGLVQ